MTFQALFLCSVCLFAIARAYGYFNHLLEYGIDIYWVDNDGIDTVFIGVSAVFYYLLGGCFLRMLRNTSFWKTNYNAIIGAWGDLFIHSGTLVGIRGEQYTDSCFVVCIFLYSVSFCDNL